MRVWRSTRRRVALSSTWNVQIYWGVEIGIFLRLLPPGLWSNSSFQRFSLWVWSPILFCGPASSSKRESTGCTGYIHREKILGMIDSQQHATFKSQLGDHSSQRPIENRFDSAVAAYWSLPNRDVLNWLKGLYDILFLETIRALSWKKKYSRFLEY